MNTGRGKGKSKKANDECSNLANKLKDKSLQKRVFDFVGEKGLTTCDMAEMALDLSHQSCSATFNALMRKGLIEKSGQTATTRYGRHGFRMKIRQMDALYSHYNPRRKIQRYNVLAKEAPARYFCPAKWLSASDYVGVGCELFGCMNHATYLQIPFSDARNIYRAYKKRYDIHERLQRLSHACTIISKC